MPFKNANTYLINLCRRNELQVKSFTLNYLNLTLSQAIKTTYVNG